jgi:hypothetical protein
MDADLLLDLHRLIREGQTLFDLESAPTWDAAQEPRQAILMALMRLEHALTPTHPDAAEVATLVRRIAQLLRVHIEGWSAWLSPEQTQEHRRFLEDADALMRRV